jgi:hypothetical protein
MNRNPIQLPALSDSAALHARLDAEEHQILASLRHFESLLRLFEDQALPAYQVWLRREFGPLLSAIEQGVAQVRGKQILLQRVEELLEEGTLHPREALFEALHGRSPIQDAERQARKRAKLETKRELRREARRSQRKANREKSTEPMNKSGSPGKKILNLYRQLARRLHPDSTRAEGATAALHQRIWLEVQAAYEASDLHRLISLASWLNSGSETLSHSKPHRLARSFSERYETLRTLKRSLAQTERKALELRERREWEFTAKSASASRNSLKREIKSELEAELAQAHEALAACEDAIASIGPPRPPRKNEPSRRGRH